MATVTSFTAERMLASENETVRGGFIDLNGHLILQQHDGTQIDAGNAKGPKGDDAVLPDELKPTGKVVTDWNTAITNGRYWGKAAINGPVSTSWYVGNVTVFVDQSAGTNRIMQEVREATVTNARYNMRYVRVSIDNGATWTAWQGTSDGQQTTNWNNALTPGNYWGNGATNQPATGDNWWVGEVSIVVNSNTFTQRLWRPNANDGRVYQRFSTDIGVTWSAWKQTLSAHVADTSETLGRAYFSTDPFKNGATQGATETYMGASPQNGLDDSMNNAFWFTSNGVNLATILKTSQSFLIYDSGWITSGLTITPATNFAINSYRLRQVGNRLSGKIQLTYSGTSLTADSAGNFADTNILTMPTGYRENSGMFDGTPLHLERNGVAPFWARAGNAVANTAGVIQLVTGTFNAQIFPAAAYELYIDYYLN